MRRDERDDAATVHRDRPRSRGTGGCEVERRLSSLVGLASQPRCTARRQTQPEACVGVGSRGHVLDSTAPPRLRRIADRSPASATRAAQLPFWMRREQRRRTSPRSPPPRSGFGRWRGNAARRSAPCCPRRFRCLGSRQRATHSPAARRHPRRAAPEAHRPAPPRARRESDPGSRPGTTRSVSARCRPRRVR